MSAVQTSLLSNVLAQLGTLKGNNGWHTIVFTKFVDRPCLDLGIFYVEYNFILKWSTEYVEYPSTIFWPSSTINNTR